MAGSSPSATPGPKTLCFDLDGTLCTNTFGDYEVAEPYASAIERVNGLAAAGHRILVFTARGTATGIDWGEVTRAQLGRWGLSYDELHFGKPSADVYVDDRGVPTATWLRGDGFAAPGFSAAATLELPTVAPPPLTVVVEVGRTYAGAPLRLADHARRARTLAQAAAVPDVPSVGEIQAAVLERLAAHTSAFADRPHPDDDLLYAISLTGRSAAVLLDTWEAPTTAPLEVACRWLHEAARGLNGVLASEPGADGIAVRAGTGGGDGSWPVERLETGGWRDGLGGQLGLVRDDRLVLQEATPIRSVESAWLHELLPDLGIEVEERRIELEELRDADEAVILTMPWCLVPVAMLDGSRLGRVSPGPVARRVLAAWSAAVDCDLGAQAGRLAAYSASTSRQPVSRGE